MKRGDAVVWKSQAGGYVKAKSGVIVAVVAPGERPDRERFKSLCRPQRKLGSPRKEESYVVQVGIQYYWPRTSQLRLAGQTNEQFAAEALDRLCELYSKTLSENTRRTEVVRVLVDWSYRKGISAPMQTSPFPVGVQSRIPVETVIEKLKSLYPHITIDALRFSAEWEEVLKNSNNSFIPCIRVIRAHTGLGLKEAVEFCRAWLYLLSEGGLHE